ncbi:carotenoid oxygenase [Aspergillus heteromorphus CBS 117.55]|uniref:Carotenoid oxygenase n=1 Tax=Aspergillus heteromorphus CBS 117.55 TaxID=1448321 RepID=A0A317X3T5_9EURO|nr:carotenoid oxygenase [Aspergillus heteromorphus CBS 117.55]PWY92831.1 carotenoid oxygenase [Aspergillus heteromorphus CBS 117.55]
MAQPEPPRTPFKNWPNDAGFDATVEQHNPLELPIIGTFPSCLAGTLYRTGPGTYKVPDSKFQLSHWFDGFTHLHRFQLVAKPKGGCKVFYTSRRQVDAMIEEARKLGSLKDITFGQKRDPCESIFHKVKSIFLPAINKLDPVLVNSGVTVFANAPVAPPHLKATERPESVQFHNLTTLTDANVIKHINPDTLEPLGVTQQTTLHPSLKGPLSCAHAEIDPESGDLYNYNLSFGRNSTYRIFRTCATTNKTSILATITGPAVKPAYLHSFFLSPDYVILCIWPCVIAAGGIRILWERNVVDALRFDPTLQTRWYVVDRRNRRGVVATFLSPAFFSFHTINAWQKSNEDGTVDIICDIIQYPTDQLIRGVYYEAIISTGKDVEKYFGNENSRASLVRYRLAGVPREGRMPKSAKDAGLPGAEALCRVNSEYIMELPTINPRFKTTKTRYVYAVLNEGKSSFFDALVKVDLETQKLQIWSTEHHTPGEAIFIPNETDNAEDAGFLLSVVLNGDTRTSYLLCLDARNLIEVGRAECPAAVGFGFHGSHYPPPRKDA